MALRISKLSDYALVLLIEFARAKPERAFSARELAVLTRIPRPTVSKVLKQLTRANILTSARGSHGGYRMTSRPIAVPVSRVLEIFEGPLSVSECLVAGTHCAAEHFCPVQGSWSRVNKTINHALSQLTIHEMAYPNNSAVKTKASV
jgi:FeS assembly SUF system regulator